MNVHCIGAFSVCFSTNIPLKSCSPEDVRLNVYFFGQNGAESESAAVELSFSRSDNSYTL